MPLYFFHLVSPGEYSRDEIGTEFPNVEAAYLEGCEAAFEMSFEMLRKRVDPSKHAFEITAADGTVVFELPFTEVIRPADHAAPSSELHANRKTRKA